MNIYKIFVELNFYPAEQTSHPKVYNITYCAIITIKGNNYFGKIEFVNKLRVSQGEDHIEANIIFPFKELIEQSVSIGDKFTFGEPYVTLGEGVVLKICDLK